MMNNSIRKKMLLFILVPILAIYAGATAFNIYKTEQWHTTETRQHMTALVQNHAARFDSDLREIAQVALSTATFLETNPNLTEQQLYTQLKANVSCHPLVYGAAIAFEPYQFSSDRNLFSPYVYKTNAGLEQMDIGVDGYDYTAPQWAWWHLPKTKGQGVWTDPYFDEGAGDILMCTFSAPFYHNGVFRGVVTVDLPLTPLREKVLADIEKDTWVSVVTRDGQYVYSQYPEHILKYNIREMINAEQVKDSEAIVAQILSGRSGSVLLDDQEHGALQWMFYAPIPSTNWIFGATISDQVVLKYATEQLYHNLSILGLSLVLIVFCIWFVSKRITDPLEHLSAATVRISEGDLKTPIDVQSNDEVGLFAKTLREMADKIIVREQTLEKERQNQFVQLVEGLGGNYFYYRHDPQGVITSVSSTVEHILGYTPEEFTKNYETFLSDTPLNKQAILHTEGSIRGEQQPIYEIDMMHKDGHIRRIEVFERPVFNDSGRVIAVEGMSRDITVRIAETERLAGLLNAAPDSIIVTNEAGEIVLINVQTEKMFGYAREELMGQKVEILIPESLRKNHPGFREAFTKKAEVRSMGSGLELLAQRKDGSTFSVEISLSPFQTESGLLISAAIRDITERKEAAEELRRSRDEAERAAQEAEAANQAKSIFLANMSHEIRTPMNAILGFTDILNTMVSDRQQKDYLHSIRTSGKSLLTLINDILDLSRVEAGKLELARVPVDTRHIFEDMARMFDQNIKEKQLEFFLDVDEKLPDVLILDDARLRQILINLIGNAVKFTNQGHITLRVQCEQRNAEAIDLTLDVEDTGIGIPPDQQDAIFGAFTQRAGQSINQYGGTGLGLSITKRLVDLMGGQIVVSSQMGVGSIFRVRINDVPIASSDVLISQVQNTVDVDTLFFEPAKILITDDVKNNRELIKGYLLAYPFEILEAEDGQQAIDMMRQHSPDVTLMDIKMPILDGYTAMKRIRSDEVLNASVVVALTAVAMRESEAEIRAVSDGLVKNPVSQKELISELARHLKHTVVTQDGPGVPETKNNEDVGVEVSDEARLQLPDLIDRLQSYKSQVDLLLQTLTINDVEAFAEEMKALSKSYQYAPLLQWGEKLALQTSAFDMDNMAKTLGQYDQLIKDAQTLTKDL